MSARHGPGADWQVCAGKAGKLPFASRPDCVASQSTRGSADPIADFDTGDRIDLWFVDAGKNTADVQQFAGIGFETFVVGLGGDLRAYSDGLGRTVVEAETSGDARTDIQIVLDNGYAIGAEDFILL